MKGYFITFEGIEGAGKSTQSVMLHNHLLQNNKKVVLTREPGGTKTGKKIREILLSHTEEIFPPLAELFLYEADRSIHINNLIKPKLKEGFYVICDRFTDSTLAYQGYARGLDINKVKEMNSIATEGIKPDITFLIDIPVEEGLKRISKEREKDRIENEELHFHRKIREGFLKIAEEEKNRIVVLDGTEKPEVIFQKIVEILKNRNII
ncbi:dTMP kinase [Persephonella hydrogeniphila]|uniref:Thymidylate kinase n=1 Tax=Persephonella hydrogeniphila TaxID=198703 RepID=A0A285NAX4_9AQUI|nr:dTMP kinase [Persephonella hydrogeniphila]SNZ06579.1 dTMP kinase [Persephonella hydrogeniphila]